ncbi:FAD-dependent monooxygenase [Actinoallomurus vinaceus]
MNETETHVLIAGAGPAGLTLACDLARRGVDFRIVEREQLTGSRGKGLQPRTLEVFDDLGVVDAVLASGAPYPLINAYKNGSVVWQGRMHEPAEPTPDVPYPNVWMVPQWRTEEILRNRLAELGGRVEQAEVTGFEQDTDGVTVELDGGRRVRAAYLVGADGGRSLVRKRLGVRFDGETHEAERMLIADVRTGDLDRGHWHVWGDMATQKLTVGLCPLPGTDVFQLTAPIEGEETPDLSLETFQKIVSSVADVRLTDIGWTSVYRVNIRMAERFRADRVFLAGDAAHVHSPAGGQGLNTGIQDAYNLGWKLARGGDTLLGTYEEERLPVAAGVLGISTRLYRKAVEGQADAFRRGEETQQLGIGYPDSPLSVGGGKAGGRAPDAPCHSADGRPARLFDVFRGPHVTVLGFGATHAETVARINASYGPAVRAYTVGEGGDLVDTEGHARAAYGTDGIVVVRPDGYIGSYDADPDAYLRSIA